VRVIHTIAELGAELDRERAAGGKVGLVPTMGALHRGHASLIRRAAEECDHVVTTIFVNPLQFAANEDLAAYPRSLESDTNMAQDAGAAIVFAPSTDEMYPGQPMTTVSVDDLSRRWEGESRPTHFAGVATVVAKLFAITGRCRAYFGEKDYQQLVVIRRMAKDLSFPVDVIGCRTVRDDDGLALSSRNAYLTADERRVAPLLHQALQAGRAAIEQGTTDPDIVEKTMRETLAAEAQFGLDYAAVVDANDLTVPAVLKGELRLLIAARLGRARLIDNLGVTV
jgi:pantoate--beta-alanine ligase